LEAVLLERCLAEVLDLAQFLKLETYDFAGLFLPSEAMAQPSWKYRFTEHKTRTRLLTTCLAQLGKVACFSGFSVLSNLDVSTEEGSEHLVGEGDVAVFIEDGQRGVVHVKN